MREVVYIRYAEETECPGVALAYNENIKTGKREGFSLIATKHIISLQEDGSFDHFDPFEDIYRHGTCFQDKNGVWLKVTMENESINIAPAVFNFLDGVSKLIHDNSHCDYFRGALSKINTDRIIKSIDDEYYILNNNNELVYIGCEKTYEVLIKEGAILPDLTIVHSHLLSDEFITRNIYVLSKI